MDLSIIIVNYNAKYFLEQCLHSVYRALKNIRAEIIIVDNHSSDQSLEWVQSRFPKIIYLANSENLGFARANNQGLVKASGKWILFLNPDTIVSEGCILSCLEFGQHHEDAGAIGVRMIDGSGKFLPESKRGLPMATTSFYRLFGLSKLFTSSGIFNSYYQPHVKEKEIHSIEVVAGAFMMVNRSLLESLNGFDERFFMYGEDIDLCYRIRLKGLTNYYLGNQNIIHFKGESTTRDAAYVERFYKAMEQFLDKHFRDRYSDFQFGLIHLGIRIRKMMAHIFNGGNATGSETSSRTNAVLMGDKISKAELSSIISSLGFQEVQNITDARSVIFCEGHEFSFSSIMEQMQDRPGEKLYRIHALASSSIVGSDAKDRAGQTFAW